MVDSDAARLPLPQGDPDPTGAEDETQDGSTRRRRAERTVVVNRKRLLEGKAIRGLRQVGIASTTDQENRRLTTLRKEAGQTRTRIVNRIRHGLSYCLAAARAISSDEAAAEKQYDAWAEKIWQDGAEQVIDELIAYGAKFGKPPRMLGATIPPPIGV